MKITSTHSSDIDFKDFMKLCKEYTKEPYLFSVREATLSSDKSLKLRKNFL